MRTTVLRPLLGLAALCLTLSFCQYLFAAPGASRDLLVQAYTALERADHDYKGHRAAAMKQIQAAGKLLGVSVWGEGKGHEKQFVSDAQLRTAQSLLEQAKPGLSGKALKHVENALQQLSIALAIK
jgi:hypothetical protein